MLDGARGALTLHEMQEAALSVKDVHRRYLLGGHELHVLRGVSLDVERGERLFLCGASGSGKTTLLYILGGLERPSAGEVCIGGRSMYGGSPRQRAAIRNRQLGFVFQNYHLLPELTAIENVMLPSLIGGRIALARCAELLERVGLGGRMQHLPTELSGGEQQRVALARALVNDPGIILADEPTGNLDAATGGQIMDLLFQVVEESGKTLIVVTHDTQLATRGDRVMMLSQGLLAPWRTAGLQCAGERAS